MCQSLTTSQAAAKAATMQQRHVTVEEAISYQISNLTQKDDPSQLNEDN
jgi:hypothetical protein